MNHNKVVHPSERVEIPPPCQKSSPAVGWVDGRGCKHPSRWVWGNVGGPKRRRRAAHD